MRHLALFALVVLAADADGRDRRCRASRDSRMQDSCGGYAFFEAFPASGAGMTAECACGAVTASLPTTATSWGRASRAICTKRDFSLVSCAANLPRVMAGSPTAPLGVLVEEASTVGLASDDGQNLASASWVKSNMTCTRTATDLFGTVNGASTCTATAANATATYSVTRVIKPGSLSAFVKRRTGTGAVSLARDGATFGAITSGLTSTYKRAVSRETVGCMGGGCIVAPELSSTVADPVIVLKIATSGDAVDIDLVQDEPLEWPTSPVDVRYSVNRAAETPTVAAAMPAGASGYCMSATVLFGGGTSSQDVVVDPYPGSLSSDATHLYSGYVDTATYWVFNYLGADKTFNTSLGVPLGVPVRLTNRYDGTNLTGCVDTNCDSSPQSFTQISGALTYAIGQYTGLGHAANGVVSDIQIGTSPGACRLTMSGATATAPGEKWIAIGDSITKAPEAATSLHSWPRALMRLSGWTSPQVRFISNIAVSSVTTTYMRDTEWASVSGESVFGLVYLGGVNDLLQNSDSGAVIFARIQTVLDAARAQGAIVVPVTVLPFSNYVGWSAGRQTRLEELNAAILAYCTTNSLTCVDAYTILGTGTAINAAYDSGDGLHPNSAGSDLLAASIKAAIP